MRIRGFISLLIGLVVIGGFIVAPVVFQPKDAQACHGCCVACPPGDCSVAKALLKAAHQVYRGLIMEFLALNFEYQRTWLVNIFFKQQVLPAMQLMTEQMSAVAMHQAFIVGTFIDAKHQLETQRLFQELEVQAHKDYQPSEDFCWFGSNVRSLAASEQRSKFSAVALNERQMARHLGNANMAGARNENQDKAARWNAFTTKYCDPQDNNWFSAQSNSGLVLACGSGGGNTERINIDVDFTRLIDEPRTLEVSFAEGQTSSTDDEEDVMALASNLYGHKPLSRVASGQVLANEEAQNMYMALRSVAAKRSVAENSYNAIVGMKSQGSSDGDGNAPKTREFLASIMKELGVPEDEIYDVIGERPSYYAQLEILAKKIYQNPDFFANLYDKPANIERKSVALKSIELMLDRAIYESQIRQEMAMSVLLSSRLRPQFKAVNRDLINVKEN